MFTIRMKDEIRLGWRYHAPFWLTLGMIVASTLAVGRANDPIQQQEGAADRTGPGRRNQKAYVPTTDYVKRSIEGWTVSVNRRLLADDAEIGARALRSLKSNSTRQHLRTIAHLGIAGRSRLLQNHVLMRRVAVGGGSVPRPLGCGYAALGACSEYDPSREWLVKNGFNPDKAKSVEIGNAARFLEWSHDQPAMVLHELAHSYLDRVLGLHHPETSVRLQVDHCICDCSCVPAFLMWFERRRLRGQPSPPCLSRPRLGRSGTPPYESPGLRCRRVRYRFPNPIIRQSRPIGGPPSGVR